MAKNIRNLIIGLLLIAFAAVLILWGMKVIRFPFVITGVGPFGMTIAVIMALIALRSLTDLNYGGIFFPAAVICIIFDDAWGITAITPWTVLVVAFLLTVACEKIFPKKHPFLFAEKTDSVDTGEKLYHSMNFGSTTKYIRTQTLASAGLNCSFGELTAYFDQAEVPSGIVVINTKTRFGETDVFIPRSWNLVNHATVTFGDIDDKAAQTPGDEGGVKCIIEGSVAFGELKIVKI